MGMESLYQCLRHSLKALMATRSMVMKFPILLALISLCFLTTQAFYFLPLFRCQVSSIPSTSFLFSTLEYSPVKRHSLFS